MNRGDKMIGKLLGNRYEIIEKIGEGGMALVYKARCRLLNRYVAIKILRPEFTNDEEFINKFRKESQSAASLSHPNIVNIYDVGNDEKNIYYIVMEYVKGKTLKQIIKERGRLYPDETINIAKQIALALDHAHNNHIIHRDIKPHNILITEEGRVKVTDFGIARAVTSSTVTSTDNIIGSVHYFSPEQARGGYIDEKSDLYSLGIVIYEMITGKVPFEGESPISVALKHIQEDVTIPSSLKNNIPKALQNIIIKATQRGQINRYSNAKEMIGDLDEALKRPMDNFVRLDNNADDSPTQVIPIIKEDMIKDDQDIHAKNMFMKRNIKHKGKKNKAVIWVATATAFIMALLFTFGIFYLKGSFTLQEKKIPDLVEMPFEEAKASLEKLGLKAKIISERYDTQHRKGTVIFQDPLPGEKVKSGYTVNLTISKGSRLTDVPNLVHKNIDEIDALLNEKNLKIGRTRKIYSSLPVGIIVSQNPSAYTKVQEGTGIDVNVSRGPEKKMILMPKLIGENIDKAQKSIETAGLILGKVDPKFDDKIGKDIVINQSISEGTEVEKNTTVDLVVSKGPEKTSPSSQEEVQMKSVSFRLDYSQAKQEEFVLKIVKIQNGIAHDIYNGIHQKSKNGKEYIAIKGRGQAAIEIYFDSEFITKKQIDFETGEIY